MPTTKTIRVPALILGLAFLLVSGDGCAHRRQAFYPNDLATDSPGVRVRAPFVDVQVKGKPKTQKDARMSRRDDDDRDDDDRD